MKITLKPIGKIEKRIIEDLSQKLGRIFGCPLVIDPAIDITEKAYNQKRGQYLAPVLLDTIKKTDMQQGEKVLGITDADIYAPGRTFVFGQAETMLDAAVISLCRLRQELPPDYNLFLDRAIKEAVHELGHTMGLDHCSKDTCVMHFSSSLHDTDIKSTEFCSNCQPKMIK
jgi:archaemetzincin